MTSFHHQPSQLKSFYTHIVGNLTQLLEAQVRGQLFNHGVIEQAISELSLLQKKLAGIENVASEEVMQESAKRCSIIATTLQLLEDNQQIDWDDNCQRIESLIIDVHELVEKLALSLIDKSLFERQSSVLESIILSHEKVTQWKDFVQDILREFHGFFPFNFFTIVFSGESGINVYLYYLGDYSAKTKQYARKKLVEDLIDDLDKPKNTTIDIEEFNVVSIDMQRQVDKLEVLTVSVPGDNPGVGGILAVGYASGQPLSVQEQSIIRSLLSVMVMVVGSSKSLSRSLSELEFYAQHDPLTGLHNRRYYNDILEYEIDRSIRHRHDFSVLAIDVDNFKLVNDGHGHMAGDQVLTHLAQILRKGLRKGDVLARIGGDEFSIILPETPADKATIVAEALRELVKAYDFSSISENKLSIHVTISIGIASFPKDADKVSDLTSGADLALYQAKDSGRDFVCALSAVDQDIDQFKRMAGLSHVLKKALEDQRIIPYFQPIFDCKTGEIYSYEALARLETEDGEIISAGMFIEVADKYGISLALDHIMLRKVTEFMAHKYAETGKMPLVFVNLTPQEIQHRDILQYAADLCEKHAIPPDRIVFEVTEREAIGDMANMRKFLTQLREKGFAFALDDFGSGYNSFHYLRELHFEYVKIDGAFISNILNSKVDNALVNTLNQLCQELGMKTLAEFVESEDIMNRLCEMGIDYAQGFHLGLPQDDFVSE
ncbi:MAG: EAL domain-containing protein [Methylomarinum sp.]|nr:EAL domain-containing protein [Methylomarinum sp.]